MGRHDRQVRYLRSLREDIPGLAPLSVPVRQAIWRRCHDGPTIAAAAIQCKGWSHSSTENSADAPPPRRPGPRPPNDRARRLAVLRTALAGSAPTFQARIDAGERREQP
jgi:hypothetical protein